VLLRQLRAQALQRSSVWRKKRINNEMDKPLREDRAVIRYDVGIDFHQPVGRSVATVRAHLNRETSLGVGKLESTHDIEALSIE